MSAYLCLRNTLTYLLNYFRVTTLQTPSNSHFFQVHSLSYAYKPYNNKVHV